MPDDLEDDLDAWLDVDADPFDDAEPPSPIEIAGLEHADRLLRRKARLDSDEADVEALASQRRTQIAAWEADRTSGIGRTRDWIDRSLEGFMRAYHAANGTQTVKLPNGTLALTKAQPLIRNPQPDETLAWLGAEEHGGFVKVPEPEARLNEIKKATTPGPVITDDADRGWDPAPEGYEWHSAVLLDGGEIVPGVAYLIPISKTFRATPTKETTNDDDR